MYKQILVVVDGSNQSTQALKQASLMAEQYGANLLIGHVIDIRGIPGASSYRENLWKDVQKNADELLEGSKKQAEALGVKNVRTVVRTGNPRTEIPNELVNDFDVDLLIIGGNGGNKAEWLLVGSVTEACVRRSSCDVLTVKNEADVSLYRNILVAVDGSEQAEQALATAIALAKINQSTLKIVHVVENQAGAAKRKQTNTPDQDMEQKQMLDKYERNAKEQGVKDVESILHYGNPRQEIPHTLTDENNIDLLISGATGRGAVKRLFTGSVAHVSVLHAPSDILTVKNKA